MRSEGRPLPALALAILLAFPAILAIPALAPGESSADHSRPSVLLRFRAGEYDPDRQPPPLPRPLVLDRPQGVFIVQFDGPVLVEWARWLSERGDILAYIPDFAFVVRSPDSSPASLRSHPNVRFVGPFEPGFKLEPALRLDGTERRLNIVPFPGADLSALGRRLASLGAAILQEDPFLVVASATGRTALRLAFDPDVQWIEEAGEDSPDNHRASIISAVRSAKDGAYDWNGTDSLWSYNATTGRFEGHAGQNVTVAVCDTGVDGTHPAFEGRMTGYVNYSGGTEWTDPGWHGTHVAGTVLGNGSRRAGDPGTAGYYAGMAPLANLVGQNRFSGGGNYTAFCRDAFRLNATIQSNSWSSSTASDGGKYETRAVAYDRLVRDADPDTDGNQTITEVFSAGNNGPGARTVSPPTTAKNVISVGAADNANGTTIASFSSRGPCLDGRVKPDIVAPGVSVTSARANSASSYWSASGTSMSCPVVSGAAAVAYGFHNGTRGAPPSPAMLKAVLLNGADPLPGYQWPGPDQGWGRLNLSRSLLNTTGRTIWSEDQNGNLSTGEWRNYTFRVTNSSELKLTLVWTDVPGALNANPALVNDLDLLLVSPSDVTYRGNQFTDGYSNQSAQNDTLNNVEMARLAAPETGWWTLSVRGANVPVGPQEFALVVSGPFGFVFPEAVDLRATDLRIAPQDPEEGDLLTVTGSLTNDGPVVLPQFDCRVRVMSDGGPVCETVLSAPRLAPGENWTLELGWVAVRGFYNATLEVDPLLDIPERLEDNNGLSAGFKVRGYGLVLSCAADRSAVDPGASAGYELSLENTGNAPDGILVAIEAPPGNGWSAALDSLLVQLGPGEARTVRATLACPAGAKAFGRASFDVRATSEGNSTYTSAVSLAAAVNQIFGLGLAAERTEMSVLPGETASFFLTLSNAGNGPDTYTLHSSAAFPAWPARLDTKRASLESGESENITLNVTPPVHALAFESCTVTVRSSDGGRAPDRTLTFTTRVRPVPGLRLELASSPPAILPGSSGRYLLRLTNAGNHEETFRLEASLPAGWTGGFDREAVRLPARGAATVSLLVSVPPGETPGVRALSATAVSSSNSSVNRTVALACPVGQLFGLETETALAAATVEPGNGTEFVFSLRNTGTGEDTFILELQGAKRFGWSGELNASEVTLSPGEAATFTLDVSTPSEETNGTNVIRVSVRSAGDPSETDELAFSVETVRPPEPARPAPPPPPPPPPPILDNSTIDVGRPRSLLLPGMVLAAAVLVVAVAALVYWRNRRK
ncbi:MAG: hypothetical protein FJ149_01290 [Euryarchaeota archaeon]|nr:hypothetical protein [Euryarchaeota archaeon]